MCSALRYVPGSAASPLAPPPFYLDREIRLSGVRTAMLATVLGLGIVTLFLFAHGPLSAPLPSLGFSTLVSVLSAAACLVVRFVCYRLVWTFVSRSYPLRGSVHPAARGELPRNAYLFVLTAPTALLVAAFSVAALWNIEFGPEMWLAVAVAAAVCSGDFVAAGHVVRVNSAFWIMETGAGLDVLRPVAWSRQD